MFQELESTDNDRVMILENIKLNKENVAKSYNKKVKGNNLPKMILCGKQFYLLGQKTLGSANSLPIGKDLTLLVKLYIEEHINWLT